MEKIIQYHKISEIKPKYHELIIPFYKTSPTKIDINLNELELHYNKYLDMYEQTDGKKVGGEKINGDDRIVILILPEETEILSEIF